MTIEAQPAVPATQTPAAPKEGEKPVTPEASSSGGRPDEMSSKFAALAKKERIARLQAAQVKKQREALAERERVIAERERGFQEEFKRSPLEALKKLGYTYDDITKAALNDGKFDASTEVKEVRSEIQRLREEQAEKDKKAQEAIETAAQKAEQDAIEAFRGRISETIEAQKDKYELVHLYDASELVFQTVEEHYARTAKEGKPKILSVDEACELVEQYLESEIDRMAKTSKKFQTKYAGGKPKEGAEGGKGEPKNSTTITNSLATSAAPSLLPPATEDARLKRALAALG